MRIGIIGDIHDQLDNLERVLSAMQQESLGATICLGDLLDPAVLEPIAAAFPDIPVHIVAGNNDSDAQIKSFIDKKSLSQVHYHHLTGRLTLDNRQLAFTHMPSHAEGLLQEDFDAICFGHTHEPRILQRGKTLLINPGDIQGRFGEAPGYAVYSTDSGLAELKKVEDT